MYNKSKCLRMMKQSNKKLNNSCNELINHYSKHNIDFGNDKYAILVLQVVPPFLHGFEARSLISGKCNKVLQHITDRFINKICN